MQAVGILELIHQNVTEAFLVMRTQIRIPRQYFVAAQQQFGKIDHAFAVALLVVFGKNLPQFFGMAVIGIHAIGAQSLFLAVVDVSLHLTWRIPLVVHVHQLHQAFDGRQLIGRIQNLEHCRKPGFTVMHAQKTVAQAVKGSHPHAARIDRQHGGKTRQHFLGRLVGKGDGENAIGRGMTALDQPGNACSQHTGLAATGPGENEGRAVTERDGFELFVVKAGKELFWHEIASVNKKCAPRRSTHLKNFDRAGTTFTDASSYS